MKKEHRIPADLPNNLGALIAHQYRARTVKAELIENLLAKLRKAEKTLPGIVGFEETVGPAVERALLAGHDFVLLGERGQGLNHISLPILRISLGVIFIWFGALKPSLSIRHCCVNCVLHLTRAAPNSSQSPISPLSNHA